MADHQTKRVFESALPAAPVLPAKKQPATPALEEMTPAKYARLSSRQRREMLTKLIDYLKTI